MATSRANFGREEIPPFMLESAPGSLGEGEIEELWGLLVAIHDTWGSVACRVEDMSSRFREFVRVKSEFEPSYLAEYRNYFKVMDELHSMFGNEHYKVLFFESQAESRSTRLSHAKKFVVDELIRLYVASGGFRTYGPSNYRGYVSGSRFRVSPPYRAIAEDSDS